MDVARTIPQVLVSHPTVRELRLVGSRADGRSHELSDWDFAVEADDFRRVARDLPKLVTPLRPLAEQWDRYSSYACYMLMLRGPTKIDLIFPNERRDWAAAWEATPDTIAAIDLHFWDWALWLEQKRRHGRSRQLEKGLGDLFELLLRPLGVAGRPASVADAVDSYVAARADLERRFGRRVSRQLEDEVRPVLAR
jgi:hypothetical protein